MSNPFEDLRRDNARRSNKFGWGENNSHDSGPSMNGADPGYRFKLVPFSQIKLRTDCAYAVKDTIPREGLVVVWGAPKSGKSFWVFDLLMHVALGVEYRGLAVKQGTVVYVAAEGERGLGARTAAYRQRHADLCDGDVPVPSDQRPA